MGLPTFNVRIDPEIRKRIKKYSHINLNEIVGRITIEKLEEEDKEKSR